MEESKVIKKQVEFHIKIKECLNCGNPLTYRGERKNSFSWLQHYKCDKCNSLHEFSPNDMGQGHDYLAWVNQWQNHVEKTK